MANDQAEFMHQVIASWSISGADVNRFMEGRMIQRRAQFRAVAETLKIFALVLVAVVIAWAVTALLNG